VIKAVAKVADAKTEVKPEWRSLHLRHRPARGAPPPRLTAPPVAHHAKAVRWHSPHMKHNLRLAKAAPRPAPRETAPVRDVVTITAREAAPEPAIVAEPGERIEELFLPGAK
jgi:hypothetical protein